MKNYAVATDIKRALTGRGFVIGSIGVVLVLFLSSLEDIVQMMRIVQNGSDLANGYHAQLMTAALSSDWVTLAIPILCSLPFTAAFVDDVKTGFLKLYVHRCGIWPYIRGKVIACALSGGLALFLGTVAAYGLSALIFTPMELAAGPEETVYPYFAQFLLKAAVLFFSGAFWSLVGFTFAALAQSRYMAYASPFILYYLLIILHERYCEAFYVLYPKEWLFPSEAWVLGSLGVILLLAELSVILSFCFAIVAQRRIARG